MPKPIFVDGSGMPVHSSLWKDGEPLFYDEAGYGGLSARCSSRTNDGTRQPAPSNNSAVA